MTDRCAETQDGQQCILQAGHADVHRLAWATAAPAIAAPAPTSFARILVTPLIVLAAGYLIGGVMPGLAIAAVISIVYILIASQNGVR